MSAKIYGFKCDQTYSEKSGHKFESNADFRAIDPDDYDGLIISGGRAPEYIRTRDEVIKIVQHFFEANKPVASLYSGAQVLSAADVIEGQTSTAYPALKAEVIAAGAEWTDGIVRDENLLTGQALSDQPEWLVEFLDVLGADIGHAEPAAVDD